MKKITLTALVLLTCIPAFAAEPEPAKNRFHRHYDYSHFTELSVSNTFIVDLAFEDRWSVDIDVPDFIEPYLKISCNGDRLRIGLEKLPGNIQRKMNGEHPLHASIRMPKITKLKMSGATSLMTEGIPALEHHDSLEIDLSGASRIENLQASSNGKFSLDMSGAAKAEISADFNQIDLDLSGASKLRIDGTADFIEMECSGASSAKITGNYNISDIEVNGSSNVSLSDDLEYMKLEVSGASRFELHGQAARADVEISGASKARIAVSKELNYEVSGVSTLRVKDLGAKLRGETSRGAKIDFIK